MFSIKFEEDDVPAGTNDMAIGRIIAGDLNEEFRSAIGYWSSDDYRQQWIRAVGVVLADDARAALITSIEGLPGSGALDWWPMYREGDLVYVQFQLLVLADLIRPFDVRHPEHSLAPHTQIDEDSNHISEWVVGAEDLDKFRRACQ